MSTTTETGHDRYDGVTITFHWVTALLVVVLFATSLMWNYGPRSWGRDGLQAIHISLGISLAAVLIARLVWKLVAGRRLPPAGNAVTSIFSRVVHWALYGLLVLQAGLGFGLRWVQGEEFSFFGLFEIPQLIASNRALEHTIENLHNYVAWTLVILAGGHALVALIHRYVFKDGVLKRMLPIAG